MSKRTPKSITKDELDWQVSELAMWIDNNRPLYNRKMAFFKNYWKKYKAGKFNTILAAKGLSNFTDEAARDYNKQDFIDIKISVPARRIVDRELVAEFVSAAKSKEYDFMR